MATRPPKKEEAAGQDPNVILDLRITALEKAIQVSLASGLGSGLDSQAVVGMAVDFMKFYTYGEIPSPERQTH